MHKYWSMYKLGIQNALAYRGPMLFWILGTLIQTLIIIALWLSVPSGDTLGSYSRNELITYFLLAFIFGRFLGWYPANWVRDEIKSGEIVGNVILKPISFYKRTFIGEAAWHTVSFTIEVIIAAVLLYIFKDYFVFLFSTANVPFMVIALILALLIVQTFSICVGMLSFWFTETGTVDALFWLFLSLFGGYAVPLTFFPSYIQPLINLMPFRYMFSFPLEIYFGKLTEIEMMQGFMVATIWLVIFYFIYTWMWRNGLKVYSAWGN